MELKTNEAEYVRWTVDAVWIFPTGVRRRVRLSTWMTLQDAVLALERDKAQQLTHAPHIVPFHVDHEIHRIKGVETVYRTPQELAAMIDDPEQSPYRHVPAPQPENARGFVRCLGCDEMIDKTQLNLHQLCVVCQKGTGEEGI